jgi:hypothetical protein
MLGTRPSQTQLPLPVLRERAGVRALKNLRPALMRDFFQALTRTLSRSTGRGDQIAISAIGLMTLISGCAQQSPVLQSDPPAASQPAAVDVDADSLPAPPPPAPIPPVIDLAFFQFVVPQGTVSHNDQFWQNVLPAVDDDTAALLDRNGLRVGEASVQDWKGFAKILNKAGALTTGGHFLSIKPADQEVVMTPEIDDQTLFYFDRHGLAGDFYDHSQNIFSFTYGPAPQQSGVVRLDLTPLIRSVRKHYEFTELNHEQDIEIVNSQHLFDLGLSVDIPQGRFLLIAPSAQSARTTSIGHQFMTQDAHAGRREKLLMFLVNPSPTLITPATMPSSANASPPEFQH